MNRFKKINIMILRSWLKMFFQSRPANPPEGEIYIYADEEKKRPVWQDKDGVHGFGDEDAIVGAMLNDEEVPVEAGKLVLDIDIPEIPDDYITGATIGDDNVQVNDKKLDLSSLANTITGATLNGEEVPVEDKKLALDGLVGSGGGITGATVNGNAVSTDSENRLILRYPKVFVLEEGGAEPANFEDGDILIVP